MTGKGIAHLYDFFTESPPTLWECTTFALGMYVFLVLLYAVAWAIVDATIGAMIKGALYAWRRGVLP